MIWADPLAAMLDRDEDRLRMEVEREEDEEEEREEREERVMVEVTLGRVWAIIRVGKQGSDDARIVEIFLKVALLGDIL
jgi:hypothetical protein